MNVTFRPIEEWPEPGFEPHKDRPASLYKSTWTRTLEILEYELWRLDSEAVVISLALTDRDIRRDGWPRQKAEPEHPGVILEFQTPDGWQRYSNDLYVDWHDNVHDTALLLQDLRAVGRRGAARGQQYTGFLEAERRVLDIEDVENERRMLAGALANVQYRARGFLTNTGKHQVENIGRDPRDEYWRGYDEGREREKQQVPEWVPGIGPGSP